MLTGYSVNIYGRNNQDCWRYNVAANQWIKFATSTYTHTNSHGKFGIPTLVTSFCSG